MTKKILNIFIFSIGLVLILPAITNAADFTFYSLKNIYAEEENFSVEIKIDPKEETIYTAKVQINYPADLLKVQSFNFSDSWLCLNQEGYDLIDNASGSLIKTAGYSGGLSSSKTLGTIFFYVKKSGSATIRISGESLLLNAENQNVFSGVETQSIFTLKEKLVPKPVEEKEEKIEIGTGTEKSPEAATEEPKELGQPDQKIQVIENEQIKMDVAEEDKDNIANAEISEKSFLASIGNAVTQSIWFKIMTILCLFALAGIGARQWLLSQKKRKI